MRRSRADRQGRRSADAGLRAGGSARTHQANSIEKYRGELFKREYLPRVKPFPRVRDLFLRIKRDGHRIALASSANADELESYKKLLNVDDLDRRARPRATMSTARSRARMCSRSRLSGSGSSLPERSSSATRRTTRLPRGARGCERSACYAAGFRNRILREAGCVEIYRDPADLLDRYAELHALVTRAPQTPSSRYAP